MDDEEYAIFKRIALALEGIRDILNKESSKLVKKDKVIFMCVCGYIDTEDFLVCPKCERIKKKDPTPINQ